MSSGRGCRIWVSERALTYIDVVALIACSDLSAAAWLSADSQPWEQLISMGPTGFAAYARVRFLPDPAFEGQSENDVEPDEDAPLESQQLHEALQVLAVHTRTPDDCYFCLWDGWGWTVYEDNGALTLEREQLTPFDPTDYPVASGPPPGWAVPAVDRSGEPPQRPHASKIAVLDREYFLFRGALSEFGSWDIEQAGSDAGTADLPVPAFIWPADRTWCIANDVDPHWAGIGATTAAIDQLMTHSRLDVVRADPRKKQPLYR